MIEKSISEEKKACPSCGAELRFKPGTHQLFCAYCGYEEFIAQELRSLEELELDHYLKVVGENAFTEQIKLLDCKHCGASQHIEEHYKSLHCVYCGEPLILEDAYEEGWILPGALVPFQLDTKAARVIFKNWVDGLWFAPNNLKRAALDPEGMHGLYVPYWTFDSDLTAHYKGSRGEYYYETQRYRSGNKNKARKVRKTRWYAAAGTVNGQIDDILISASKGRRHEIPAKIAFWNVKELVPFNAKYLSGFVTEKYTVTLKEGHAAAFTKAKEMAYQWIRMDIGGDTQRISQANITLARETFKHVLLPVYLSAYRFKGKEYRFYINGQTGQVHGARPYSTWKIVFLVLVLLVLVAVIAIFVK